MTSEKEVKKNGFYESFTKKSFKSKLTFRSCHIKTLTEFMPDVDSIWEKRHLQFRFKCKSM